MNPKDFLRTLYLGDRACKSILLDIWNHRIAIQVDRISRIRSESGNWEFYEDEDIDNGNIVFYNVLSFRFDPPGLIPNDLINSLAVSEVFGDSQINQPLYYRFHFSIDSVDEIGNHSEVIVEIIAAHIYLEDPKHPGLLIQD